MTLSLDVVALGVPDVPAAHAFYSTVLATADAGPRLDLRGAGALALHPAEELTAATAGTPRPLAVLSYVVPQPTEVRALLEAAAGNGAEVVKPAKKGFFGGFTAVFRAPDGVSWKLAAPTRKDTGPAAVPPAPTETVVVLGVRSPKASAAFYAALGMAVERDYGDRFVDFRVAPGTTRLGLMPRAELAEDAGTGDGGSPGVVLTRRAGSADEVSALLSAAVAAGGRVVVPLHEVDGGCAGRFADPDGFVWEASSV